MASSKASPMEMPESDITMFNTVDTDYESLSKFKEPQPNVKHENDFEDLDPLDEEEMLAPSKPTRVRRVVPFRPLFVYRQEQDKEKLIAADRRSGRSSEDHRRHGQGHGHERNHHHQHGY